MLNSRLAYKNITLLQHSYIICFFVLIDKFVKEKQPTSVQHKCEVFQYYLKRSRMNLMTFFERMLNKE